MGALNPAFASPSSRPLPIWFGYALIAGDRVLSTVTAPSSISIGGALYGIYICGEGECDGMEMFAPQQPSHLENGYVGGLTKAQYYAGITGTFHWHGGRYTIKGAGNQLTSIGPDQQYDSFLGNFPSVAPPQSFSGMAYYVLGEPPQATPLGVGTPFPLAPMGIMRGIRCRIFDSEGNVTGYGFTTNPAWHLVEVVLRFKIKPQQPGLTGLTDAERACFNWPAIVELAQRNDFILPNGRPRFVGNYVFAAGTTMTNILETILRVSRSYQRLEGTKIAFYGDDLRTSIFLMGANNVVPGTLKLAKKDISKAPNVYIPKYRDIDIPAVARVISVQRQEASFAPIPYSLFTLGSLSPFVDNDVLQYGGSSDPTFDGAYRVVSPLITPPAVVGTPDTPNQVRAGGLPGAALTSASGGYVGTNDARFSERAPTNVVHRSAQKMVAMQAPGLASQPKIIPVQYDMGNSTFDQTNRVMKFERDRTLGTDTAIPVAPTAPTAPVITPPAPPFAPPTGQSVAWAYATSHSTPDIFSTGGAYFVSGGASSTLTGGSLALTNGSPFAPNSVEQSWWGFSLPAEIPPDATITGVYPVMQVAGTGGGFATVGTNPFSWATAPSGTTIGPNVGTLDQVIYAQITNSAPNIPAGDGTVLLGLDIIFVGMAVYYEGAPVGGGTGGTGTGGTGGSASAAWKAPITGTLSAYFEAIDVNGKAAIDVNDHDVITLDDWVTPEFTGDYEILEHKITAPAGGSLGQIDFTLHQYNPNAYTDVSDDPGGSYATVPSTDLPFGTFPLTNAAWTLQATPRNTLNAGTGLLTVKIADLSIQIMGRIAPTLYPNASWTGLAPGSPYVLYVDDPLGTGVAATFGFQAGTLPLTANPVGRYVVLSGIFEPNNFVNIDLQTGTATFFSGSGADSTTFQFPSTAGSELSNLIAWSSPRGHIDAGSNHLHYISDSQVDASGLLHLHYNDSVGDQWAGPVNYAGITWGASASAAYSTIGSNQFVTLTLAGGEVVCFGQGNLTAGAPVVLPAGFTLAKSILMAFPFSNTDAGQPTLGVQAYVDPTGHAFFKMNDGSGLEWQGTTQPFIFAWQNNMGTVTTSGGYVKIPLSTGKTLYLGGFSILDNRRGGSVPANFPSDNLTHVLSGGKLPLPAGVSADTLQVMPGPNSFDYSTPSNPAHGVNECLVDSSQNVLTSFSDGGNAHVWYGSSSVFALLYE